ncbi:hypothetical protein CN918_25885 [Priestia megaterium]|nr:hypothetical protein CN918_25885 [Priestia megaterium]
MNAVHPLWKERLSFSFRQPREIGILLALGLVLGNIISVITCATFTGMNGVPFLLVWTLTIIGTVFVFLLIHVVDLVYTEEIEEDVYIRRNMQKRVQLKTDKVMHKEMKHIADLQKLILDVAEKGHMEIAKEMTDVYHVLCEIVTTLKLDGTKENYIKNILPLDFINLLNSYQKTNKTVQEHELHKLVLLIQNKKVYLQQNYIEQYRSKKLI